VVVTSAFVGYLLYFLSGLFAGSMERLQKAAKDRNAPYFVHFVLDKIDKVFLRSVLYSPFLMGLYQGFGYSHKLLRPPPILYLSDGGHLENLGVEQLLMRRCSTIVVVDVAADPTYECLDIKRALERIEQRGYRYIPLRWEKPHTTKDGRRIEGRWIKLPENRDIFKFFKKESLSVHQTHLTLKIIWKKQENPILVRAMRREATAREMLEARERRNESGEKEKEEPEKVRERKGQDEEKSMEKAIGRERMVVEDEEEEVLEDDNYVYEATLEEDVENNDDDDDEASDYTMLYYLKSSRNQFRLKHPPSGCCCPFCTVSCCCGEFPHDSTANQFFTKKHFKCYSTLGNTAARDLCEELTAQFTELNIV